MKEDNNPEQVSLDREAVRSFGETLKEQSVEDLLNIITKYINYEPETVEAALIVSVDRGILTYDMKEQLSRQIFANFSAHTKGIKQTRWEVNNAFIGFATRYTDDEIYNFIEDPSDIVIDVYYAILETAKARELISAEDMKTYKEGAMAAIKTEDEIKRDEWLGYIKDVDTDDVDLSESEIEEEKEKYWKCPFCSQLVDMDLAVCWNCQAEMPKNFEHPDKEEIIKELAYSKPFSFTSTGFGLAGAGILMGLLAFIHHHGHNFGLEFDPVLLGIGVVSFLAGIIVLIIGIFFKSPQD
jgi:hypothetical protein